MIDNKHRFSGKHVLTLLAVLLTPLGGFCVTGAEQNANAVQRFAAARWIGFGDPTSKHADARFAFRKMLKLAAKPTSAPVHVTADARYIRWVNGEFVGRGPARGFPWAQPYDEFDLAQFLRPGLNWIAAEMYQFGKGNGGPSARPTARDEVVKLAINPINRLKVIP